MEAKAFIKARQLYSEGHLYDVKRIGVACDALVTNFDKTSDEDVLAICEMIEEINHRHGDLSHNSQSFAEAMNSLFEARNSLQQFSIRWFKERMNGEKEKKVYEKFVNRVVDKCYS